MDCRIPQAKICPDANEMQHNLPALQMSYAWTSLFHNQFLILSISQKGGVKAKTGRRGEIQPHHVMGDVLELLSCQQGRLVFLTLLQPRALLQKVLLQKGTKNSLLSNSHINGNALALRKDFHNPWLPSAHSSSCLVGEN